jgi:hypothetical protein
MGGPKQNCLQIERAIKTVFSHNLSKECAARYFTCPSLKKMLVLCSMYCNYTVHRKAPTTVPRI